MPAPRRSSPRAPLRLAVVLLLLLLAHRAAAQTSAYNGPFLGLTDDPCRMDDDCRGDLRCRLLRENAPLTPCDPLNNESCSCVHPDGRFMLCKASADCPRHERCIAPNADPALGARCSSCSAFFMVQSITKPVDNTTDACPRPTPTPTPRGFAQDECDPNLPRPCRRPATCARFDKDTLVACGPGDTLCDCQPREAQVCRNSRDCPPGERCVARGFDAGRPQQCISCVVAQDNPQIFRFVDIHAASCMAMLVPTATPHPKAAPLPVGPNGTQPHCPPSNGVTLDHCCADAGAPRCAFPRRCASIFTKQQCRPGEVSCVCLSPATASCKYSTDCPYGERCVQNGRSNTCISCSRVAASTIFQSVDEGADRCKDSPVLYVANVPVYPSLSPSPTPSPSPSVGPTALDTDLDVSPGPSEEPEVTPEMEEGIAVGKDPLLAGEKAAKRGLPSEASATDEPAASPDAEQGSANSSSSTASTGSSGTSTATTAVTEGVCIGAHHLEGLPASALVFRRHVQAAVLCDAARSCATSGHVVTWRGRAQTMRTYCRAVGGCTEENMAVNSVRMRRGARVASGTTGLEFTALAARWGTRAEEAALAALVRLGM